MKHSLTRREFVRTAATSVAALPFASMLYRPIETSAKKTHIVTFSFDDGFKKSFHRVADIYEAEGLRACLNVIAIGHELDFAPVVQGKPDAGIVPFPKGDWTDWNALKARGHEVMAHTYNHVNLTTIPLDEAKALITKCAESFEANLKGFKASESVYNFAYNASTPELEAFVLTKFLVARSQGDTPMNPIPTRRKPVRIGCYSHGPDNCDEYLNDQLNQFLSGKGGWFVFNTHGLDEEGWGPISTEFLVKTLKRLKAMPNVEIRPAGEVVTRLKP